MEKFFMSQIHEILENKGWSQQDLSQWKFMPSYDQKEKLVFQLMESISKSKRIELWKKYMLESDPEDIEDIVSAIPIEKRLKNLSEVEKQKALKLLKAKEDKKD